MRRSAKLPSWWPYCALFLFALLVRIIYLAEIGKSDVFWILVGDGFVYETWALQITQDWIGKEIFYQAPLYPYFLATVYLFISDDTLTVRLIQFLLGATSCVLLARAGKSFFPKQVGLLAGFLLAVYAPALFFEGIVQKAVFDVFFMTLLLFALGKNLEQDKFRWPALAGLAIGALALTRENALALWPIVLLWLFVAFPKRPVQRRTVLAAAFVFGTMLALLPVGFRNWHVGGQPFLTTSQFGPNFYIGNNSKADGTYKPLTWGRGSALLERLDATVLAEEALGKNLSPAEVSSYWTRKAFEDIKRAPAAWVKLLWRKWMLTWNATEISDSEEPAPYQDQSLLLTVLWKIFNFGIVVPLAVAGCVATWKERRKLWVLYLMLGAMAGAIALFFVFARYRMVLIPLLVLFAAAGIIRIIEVLRERNGRKIGIYAAILAISAFFVHRPLYQESHPRVMTYFNMAVSLEMQGNEDIALAYYAIALDQFPNLAGGHFNRGLLLAKRGRFKEAEIHFRQATILRPDDFPPHYQLGKMLLALDRPEEAAEEYRKVLKLKPELAEAKAGLERALKELKARQKPRKTK